MYLLFAINIDTSLTMVQLRKISGLYAILLLPFAYARLEDGRHANRHPFPIMRKIDMSSDSHRAASNPNATSLPPITTTYYFDQLIDHSNPSLGTFKQRYWHTWEFYEPGRRIYSLCNRLSNSSTHQSLGGPIILTTPGEGNADGTFRSPSCLRELR